MRNLLSLLLCAGALGASATTIVAASQVSPWGIYLDYIDKSVPPGDDFFTHANGGWLKSAQIPLDRPATGAGLEVSKQNEERLKAIVTGLHQNTALSEEETKLRDLYDAYLDEKEIETKGLAPVSADLKRIATLKTLDDVAREMGAPALGLDGPFAMFIAVDDKNPDAYAVRLVQSGLGLPDRDYYLRDDKALASNRDTYREYLAQTLELSGVRQARSRADAVYALERKLAEASWPAADRREAEKTYNPTPIRELKKMAPGFPWDAFFASAGIPLQSPRGDRVVIVGENTAFPKLAAIFSGTPVAVWRDYLTTRYVHSFAPYLPKKVDEADFAMFGRTLQGRAQQLDRPTRGARLLDRRMGEALGRIYVNKHFPPESKAKIQQLVQHLLRAYREDLNTLDWMTAETRQKALDKLEHFTVKVGYPDRWRDYSSLQIARNDLIGSIKNSNRFDWDRDRKRLDDKVDRTEWGMTPPTVNAYYNPTANEIVFPAGILQSPFFDPSADDATNYGAIGAVIGHEISHGFDDQGSKYDGMGMLRMWWTKTDRKSFDTRTHALVKQYNEYQPLPGLHVNGQLTLGENIADLAGLTIAHKAYMISLGGKEAPVLDGYTGDQRFYLAYAQSWRAKVKDETTRQRVLSNPHSPPEYRVNGVVRNDDGWYKAFGVKEGQSYYLPPEQRIRLW